MIEIVIGEILNRLQGVKRLHNGSYQARCPCHDDKKASLTVTEKDSKILMHCHAGCGIYNIAEKLGIDIKDLCGTGKASEKSWRDKIRNLEAVYDYGSYVKLRLEGKKILYGHIVNNEFVSGMPQNTEKRLYGADIIRSAVKNGKTVYITEGEKDADNMNARGLPCCTPGGTGDWRADFAKYFKGADVVILPDNDEAGKRLADEICRDLKNIAFCIRAVITSEKDKGDVSDFFEEGKTRQDLLELVGKADCRYAGWVVEGKKKSINAGILADSIGKNLEYIILKKSGIDVADFYLYENGVYVRKSRMEFKGYIKEYLPAAYQTDALLNNVSGLMLASNENCYDYEKANDEENIINFKNGLFRLKQNELIKHTKERLTTIQLKCSYDRNAKCPMWRKYIKMLCSDDGDNVDEEKEKVLQEWFGLLMSNVKVSRTKKCLALYSSLGDTGKSIFLDILTSIVGDENTAHIPIQNMSDRFAMGNLYGKRLNCVGDQKSTDIEDSSVFKQLTGGDPLGVEMKGKTAFQFRFKGGFAFACNDLPCFKDDKGGHIFERFTIIKCERYLKPEERDKALRDKLLKEKDGIALWGLEGLIRLQKNGFNFTDCRSSEKAVSEYRGNVDTFYKFMKECFEITGSKTDRVSKKSLELLYSEWCKENEYMEIKKKNIKERAAKSGIELYKYNGDWYYRGLKEIAYKTDENDYLPEEFR